MLGSGKIDDGDSLVELYDNTVTALLDHQVPYETKSCRRRPSNVWYDAVGRLNDPYVGTSVQRGAQVHYPISSMTDIQSAAAEIRRGKKRKN